MGFPLVFSMFVMPITSAGIGDGMLMLMDIGCSSHGSGVPEDQLDLGKCYAPYEAKRDRETRRGPFDRGRIEYRLRYQATTQTTSSFSQKTLLMHLGDGKSLDWR